MLREVLTYAIAARFRKLTGLARGETAQHVRGNHAPTPGQIWALRHTSFEVPRGQILGIIGPNGAGKSTLLKILSRITEPTEGRAEIRGRVGSLLEVGTGFHPELTGRENIYLGGTLLGMRKAEIDRTLDEIISFSEIDEFVDTPVKHYSSGMYVRLAFSVAAHFEPEILIVDEVLAVGDVSFQRKCLNKMEDVRQHGRTILFVSHNMEAVTRLCERALLISKGGIEQDGPAASVVGKYLLSNLRVPSGRTWPDRETAPGDDVVRLRSIRVVDEGGVTIESVDIRRPVGLEIVYDVLKPDEVLVETYHLYSETGACVFVTHDLAPEWRGRHRPRGRFTSVAWIPGNLLAEGTLLVSPGVSTHRPFKVHAYEHHTIAFHVRDPFEGDSARGDWDGHIPGTIRPLLTWNVTFTPPADP
ncbi:MAG TPA: ABC transporter ATP-binding protein [Methylomirabilota bacterium]|nr:ABC transporter ATP-binding protein [Methylomirabilota bacterium]